jgi:YD repeat-containing protein
MLWPIDPARLLARAFPRPDVRTAALVLALAIVGSASVQGEVDLTVPPTREMPDGKLDYTPVADVSPQSGDYAPRIPLEVLPGPAGQAPALELVYSAKRANGPLGAGWGLSFESAIERKSKSGGPAEMTADDTFWIDGEKLIPLADGSYRTEQDDFTVYSKSELNGHLIGWTALKDGFARHYGIRNTFTSLLTDVNAVEYRDETVSSGVVQGQEQVRWLLSATVSPFGVEVAYRYIVPELLPLGESTFRHLPDRIIYGVSGASSNEIELGYGPRDDVRVSYANGPKRTESKLLRRIVVKRAGGTTATSHYYVLDYQAAEHSPQSLLAEVKRLEIADPAAPPTAASESSAPAESLARFAYQDSETEWGQRKAITLVGDPPLDSTPGRQYFSLPMTGDVNGDARPDLIVFNDNCHLETEDVDDDSRSARDPGDSDPRGPIEPVPISHYECIPDHRVYLNTIRESRLRPSGRIVGPVDPSSPTPVSLRRQQVLVYDRSLSRQVTNFYQAVHDQFLKAQPVAIEDLNKDGFVELIKNGKFAPGGPDGWDTRGVSISWASLLEDYQFVDINGDGNADLVSQSRYYPNTSASPYFTTNRTIVDPVTAGNASEQYYRDRARCLDSNDSGISLRADFGINGLGHLSSDPEEGGGITADEWVWQHTTHPDVNGDGLADRVISFPFLYYETQLESPDARQLWVRDDATCGVFDQVFLGDGRGGFEAAGYGIGGPMQREQTFVQTRTLDDDGRAEPESDTFAFSYHLNHFAIGDVDADGRNEITQFCANDTRFLALWHQGIGRWGISGWEGFGPGYDISAEEGACPGQFTAALPEEFFGLSLLDYHYSTILDFDGDGMADLFQYSHPYGDPHVEVSNDGTPWEDWQDGPHWRRNLRDTAQNRLVSITWPHGAFTQVAWAWSAEDPDNHFAINVEHVRSLEDAQGKHSFSFTGGAFGDGQFLGFGRVETLRPRGSTLVQTFFNSKILRNKPSTEELYDEGGRLKNLRVHMPGSDRPNLGMPDGLLLDAFVPYYNPLQRVCEFEFGAFNGAVQLGADIDPYIARCEAFEDEGGLVATPVLDQRSIFSVLRGGDPIALAGSSAEQRELAALRSLLRGEPPDRICISVPGDALRATPPVICSRSPTVPRERAGAETAAPRTAAAVSWSAAPYRTKWDLADPATELPDWGPVVVEARDERMFVTEYDYDDDIGHVVEQRELRDVSKTTDSLIREYEYSAWDPAFGGARLLHETTRNRLGKTYENIDYQNFANGQWRTRVEHDTVSGATRSERRAFTALGEMQSSTDTLGRTTSYAQGDCGITTSVTDPLGYIESTSPDSTCRPVQVSTRFGEATIAQTDITYDGYGRVIECSIDPAVGNGDGMPRMVDRFAYDADSGSQSPAAITVQPEPDGSTTLTKTYIDGWGRTLKTVRCTQGSAAGGSGLDAVYPCRSGTEVVSETRYDAATGDVAEAIVPYRPADQARPSHRFTYDEFGRMVVDEQPDGTSLSYSYGLGQRTVTDPIGRKTTVTFDTLSEDVKVGDIYRGGTRRDAFGRVTAVLDAASSQTDILYDGFNRKREERLPVVSVLASGATASVNQRPATSYAYDDGDRLISRTDANGHTLTFGYDALDRLLTTRGPDGVLLERRTYVDGGWGTRQVRVRDARLGVNREDHLDGLGRGWKQVAFDGTETLTDFDSRGRAWRQTLPWGEVRTSEVHDAGMRTVETSIQGDLVAAVTTTLDARGQPLTVTDADGQVLSYEYDPMGRLTFAWQGDLETEHRRYDRVGRAISVRASGMTTCYGYDQVDNIVTEELGCDDTAKPRIPRTPRALVTLTRTYTELGQVATELDGAGNVVASEYDALGRLIAVKVSGRGEAARGRQQFRYDAIGNQTEAVDELGYSLRTAYDDYDRPIVSDPPDQGPTSTAYTVASHNWVATATSPTGEVASTSTDAMDRQVRTCGADGICIEDVYRDGLLVRRNRLGAGAPAPVLGTRYYQYHPASARLWREWDWITLAESRRCAGTVPDDCQLPHVEHTPLRAGQPDRHAGRDGPRALPDDPGRGLPQQLGRGDLRGAAPGPHGALRGKRARDAGAAGAGQRVLGHPRPDAMEPREGH